jgi:hypothetical protein
MNVNFTTVFLCRIKNLKENLVWSIIPNVTQLTLNKTNSNFAYTGRPRAINFISLVQPILL